MNTRRTASQPEVSWYQILLEKALSMLQIRRAFTSPSGSLRYSLGTIIICLFRVFETTRHLVAVAETPKMKAFTSRALRSMSILMLVTAAALVPAIALNWLWWYVRRHCTQTISRTVL